MKNMEHYGESIIKCYSNKLVKEVGKKYNKRTLFRMKQFYIIFSNEKVAPLVQQLSWSQCLILIPIKDINEIIYYALQSERALHNLILEDIESFMHELGNNFSFIGSEYKIKIGDTYHKINLLLFNIRYNAYVVIELKITEFKVEYISQVQKYMNYVDKNIKEISNNNTIGILICKKENKFVIEYCSDERISIREYKLI